MGDAENLSEIEALVQAIETPDYTELFDEDGIKIALTVQPELIATALNALPHLLSTIRSQEAALVEAREALKPFARTEVLEPNGVIVGLERYHFTRAASALSKLEGGE